jgi:hypothetical protein
VFEVPVVIKEEAVEEDTLEYVNNYIQSNSPATDTSPSESGTEDKAVQVFIPDTSVKVEKETRKTQTEKPFHTADAQVQCDNKLLCHKCQNHL